MASQQKINDTKLELDKCEEKLEELYNENLVVVDVQGSIIGEALTQQIQLEMQFEVITKRIKRIVSEFELYVDEAYSDAISSVIRDSHKAHSITEAKEIAKTDQTFRSVKRILVRATSLYDESRGYQDVVHSRRYVLNNLTSVIVSSVKDTMI